MSIREAEKILIVDDEHINISILASILKTDYTLLFAKNGSQALQRAVQQMPDLILLDVMMPDINGYELMNLLKNDEQLKDIPVIFVSALSKLEDEEKGLLLGAVDYISKPFNPAIVKARVRNHMKLVRQRKLLEKYALLDGLTEIPNRRSFSERWKLEFRRAIRDRTPLSLAILDVDFFKQYNDNYGHAMGDIVLKKLAVALSEKIKRSTDFAARVGGEEFAIIFPETSAQGAYQLAENIRAAASGLAIEHRYSPADTNVLTVSIGGVSFIPSDLDSAEKFYEYADQMLYQAKNQGRNQVMWQDLL
jgi:diguanylate cyclase (GGDEF)-like protein